MRDDIDIGFNFLKCDRSKYERNKAIFQMVACK